MRPLLRLRSMRIALGAGLLAGLAMLPSPLLGVHGVESALLLGVLLPPFVAVVGARHVLTLRRHGLGPPAGRVLAGALGAALLVWAVPTVLLGLNALRIRQCSPWQGLAFMALGPGVGVLLAAVVGVAAAAYVRRGPIATALALLVPLAAIGAGVWRFWSTPAIFVYQHFVGWFPGTIYDEGVGLPMAFVTFRLVSLALLGGLASLVAAGWRRAAADASPRRLPRAKALAAVALLMLGGAAVAHAHGEELGHRTSEGFIAEELGVTERGERCVVHAPREMDREQLGRIVRDCDFRVVQTERTLGVQQWAPVEAFVFRSAGEKRRLMGAGQTNIAKPWRDEVYLQQRGWPHPVLEHEVVHVVAGRAAQGPFRVGGGLGGWLPNPGLIEGVAVAVAWNEREGLTPHQWAKAMVELGEMPPLPRIVSLRFVLHSASHAYTAAGSFVRFLLETEGPAVVREAYRTGDVAAATGRSLSELEGAWHRFLSDVPLSEHGLALARVRFSGRSIFARVCPHRVAHLRQQLRGDVSAGDWERALGTCRDIVDIDPSKLGVQAELVGALARTGQVQRARARVARLEGPLSAPQPIVGAAREKLADALWTQGDPERALAIYRALQEAPRPDDAARSLEVKRIGLEAGGRQAELVRRLLVPDGGGPSGALAVHIGRELSALRDDGLGPYLEARQMHHRQHFELALPLLREAERRGLPTARLRRENARLVGIALFATGRLEQAEAHYRAMAEDPEQSAGRRALAEDWLARIRWTQRR